MTDNEIIKILENEADFDCGMCCNNGENCLGEECASFISRAALDLINRQNAEIERLKSRRNFLEIEYKNQSNLFWERVEGAKSEAIREFAERLKKNTYPFPCAIGVENAVTIRAINDLVEEMAGEIK